MMINTRRFLVLASMCFVMGACSSADKSTQTAASIDFDSAERDAEIGQMKVVVEVREERKASADAAVLNKVSEESINLPKVTTLDEIKKLLKKGADVNYHDVNGKTALMQAAERDDFEAAKKLLEAGALVNALDKNAWNALHYAKSVKMARLLIDNGADIHHLTMNYSNVLHDSRLPADLAKFFIKRGVSIFDKNGSNLMPIHLAKDPSVVKYMLDAGIDPNVRELGGRTPLTNASSDEIVKMLLDAGAKTNIEVYGWEYYNRQVVGGTLLHTIKDGKAVARFLEAGFDPNAVEKNGMTPLFYVSDADGVKALVKAGADVNAVDEYGRTPLIVAEKGDVVKALIDAGADATYRNEKNWNKVSTLAFSQEILSALRYDRQRKKLEEKDTEAVKALIKAGVDVNAPVATDDRVPIHVYQNEATFDALLAANADINKLDDDGRSALHHQINVHNVQKLLDAGLDVNLMDIQGKTPIFFHTKPESLKMLLDAGADVSVIVPSNRPGLSRVEEGNNVLFYHSDPECIRMLVKAGAKVNAKNKHGNTPLHGAKSVETIKALLDAGADLKTRNDSDETAFDSYAPASEDEFNLVLAMYLDAGMNPNAFSPDGLPLLYSFIKKHNAAAVEMLLKAGANVDGRTLLDEQPADLPLITALSMEKPDVSDTRIIEIVRSLLKAGADPNQADAGGVTPLMHAKSFETVDLLLKAGADINAVDPHKDNALVYFKQSDAADLLIDKGINLDNVVGYAEPIDPSSRKRKRDFPMGFSLDGGFNKTPDHTFYTASNVKRMIKRGVNVDQKNAAGETLLMRAADEEAVQLLINAGADSTAVTGDDHSVRYKLTHRDENVTRIYGEVHLSTETKLQNPMTASDEKEARRGYRYNGELSDDEKNISNEERSDLIELHFQSIQRNNKNVDIRPHVHEILRRDSSVQTLQRLMNAGVDLTTKPFVAMALVFATDTEALKFLKENGAELGPNLSVPNSDGSTFFMNKSADAIRYMFDELGFASSATIRNGTPRDAEVLKLLLDAGAQPFDKVTILKFINDPTALKQLIRAGAFANSQDFRKEYLEQLLASLTNPESMRILIAAGDKTETPKPKSAIHFQKFGFMEYALNHVTNGDVARVLIENGALENHDDNLQYPIIAQQNNSEVFSVLVSKGASVPKEKATQLLYEATDPDMIKLLIDMGADFSKYGSPLLENQLGPEAVKMLVKYGVDPNAHTYQKGYALFYQKDPETKRALLKAGARVDTRKLPPLVESARTTHDDSVCPVMGTSLICTESLADAKMLVEAGADVNAQTNLQITPLMNHAALDHCDIVQYLLKKGADPWLQSSTYQTAYDMAISTECRNMLRKAMTK